MALKKADGLNRFNRKTNENNPPVKETVKENFSSLRGDLTIGKYKSSLSNKLGSVQMASKLIKNRE